MNVFDFDKTISTVDSTAAFLKWLMQKHPALIRHLPAAGIAFLGYALKKRDKTSAKEQLYALLQDAGDTEKAVEEFWDTHMHLIKKWYGPVQRPDDVVISASPEFLIRPICKRLGINFVMASVVDPSTGKYTGKNCDGAEKVRRFYEAFPDGHIDCFYSDSLIDTPLAQEAEKAFLVKGEQLRPWPEPKKN